MDSITIDTGVKRILVNNDPSRVITFNPSDVAFAERFYQLIGNIEEKKAEFSQRSAAIDAITEIDANGVPANVGDTLALLREFCEFINAEIDKVFGEGTAQAAFDGALGLDMYVQFVDGIAPFIEQARSEKISKYTAKKKQGRVMK